MPSSQKAPPPERAGSRKLRADVAPDVLPYRPQPRPQPIPVTWFAKLHNARAEGDYSLAKRCVRELRALGYSVVVIGTPKKGGPAR